MRFTQSRKWPKRLCLLGFLLGVCLIGAAGCQRPAERKTDGKKRVVTTFTILADIASNVAGDKAVVESITKPGAEIHEYEPTPLDIVKAQSADLVLRNGMGLERWFEKFMGSLRDVKSMDCSQGVEPIGIGEGPYNGKPNPHAWMSPANALIYVENIRKALTEIDPENAVAYATNADAYSARILAIDAPLRATLSGIPTDQRWLVTCEGAFSYLARDYDMQELFLWPVNADAEGTPQQIRKVVDTIRRFRIPVVFSESTISDKAQREVCQETGARYGGVLYVDSLTDESGPAPTYLRMLTYNAGVIVSGFDQAR
ncbi:MAG: metal ABC transporter substrate-binding protein [Candidatus Delongbacteria bacterium]|nr:metal ABC transporter substrate-binding protein [Candidatus Delongbacteria bacterium]